MANEMHYMWVFIVLSLFVGATLGMVIGMRSPTGAAISQNTALGRKTLEPTSTAQNTMATQYSQATQQMITQIENMLINQNSLISLAVKDMMINEAKEIYKDMADTLAAEVAAGNIDVGTYNRVMSRVTDSIITTLQENNIITQAEAEQFRESVGTIATDALVAVQEQATQE